MRREHQQAACVCVIYAAIILAFAFFVLHLLDKNDWIPAIGGSSAMVVCVWCAWRMPDGEAKKEPTQ